MPGALVPKRERMRIFLDRLKASPLCSSGTSARSLIEETLNQVEDELTDIPFNPEAWRSDGRLYPVQDDNADVVDGHPHVSSFESKGHITFIRDNGAFEIHDLFADEVVLSKPGADGQGVWS